MQYIAGYFEPNALQYVLEHKPLPHLLEDLPPLFEVKEVYKNPDNSFFYQLGNEITYPQLLTLISESEVDAILERYEEDYHDYYFFKDWFKDYPPRLIKIANKNSDLIRHLKRRGFTFHKPERKSNSYEKYIFSRPDTWDEELIIEAFTVGGCREILLYKLGHDERLAFILPYLQDEELTNDLILQYKLTKHYRKICLSLYKSQDFLGLKQVVEEIGYDLLQNIVDIPMLKKFLENLKNDFNPASNKGV